MQQFNLTNEQPPVDQNLPHNFLAEKVTLSCLIANPDTIEATLQTLPANAFYFKHHQEMYKVLGDMHKNNLLIDALTLTTFLQDKGLLEKVGGLKVIIDLITQVPNLIYLKEYIRLIKDKFIRRSLIKLGYEAINSGHVTSIPLEILLNNFEDKLFNLTTEIKSQKVFSSAELLSELFLELKEKSLNPSISGVASGFYDLDSFTQGFQKSDLIIIAGRPSVGKTALSLNIALNIIKESNLPVLFFSLEMSKEQIMYRLLAMESDISQIRLRSGRLSKRDWFKLNEMIKIVSKLPFLVDDTSDLSIENIKSRLKTVIFEQNKIGLIIIDYLQLMQISKSRTENRAQELSKITRSLKIIAREFNIPIIALSQLSRSIETRMDKKPILSDLRESGSIEQDADLVLMLYKNLDYNLNLAKSFTNQNSQLIELIIAKHRNGPVGTIRLDFDEKRNKFFSLE